MPLLIAVELLSVTVVRPAIGELIVTAAAEPFTFSGPACVPPKVAVPLFTLIVLERFEEPLVEITPSLTVTTPVTEPPVRVDVPLLTVKAASVPPVWFSVATVVVVPATEPPVTLAVPVELTPSVPLTAAPEITSVPPETVASVAVPPVRFARPA